MKIGAFTTTFDEVDWLRCIAPQLACFDLGVVIAGLRPIHWLLSSPPPSSPLSRLRTVTDEFGLKLIEADFGMQGFSHSGCSGVSR